MKVLGHLLGGRNSRLVEFRLDPRASDPATLTEEGLIWTNTVTHRVKYYDGTVARTLIVAGSDFSAGDIPLSALATNPLARASHTGSQTASTISDFDTQVRTNRLDQMAIPTASVSLNNQKITSLGTPTADSDAATKVYVDNFVQGLSWKDSVRAATTANSALATTFENGDVIDGVTLATGNRILIKAQTAGQENGIYTVNASGAPTRAVDADDATQILGMTVYVEEGTTNGDSIWTLTTNAPITLGTTPLSFAQVGGGTSVTGGAGLVLTGSVMDVVGGFGVTVTADAVAVNTAVVARFVEGTFDGDGATLTFALTHNLNKPNPMVQVWDRDASPQDRIIVDLQRSTDNVTNVVFAVAPANLATYAWIAVG